MMARTISRADGEWPHHLNELGPERPPTELFVQGRPLEAGSQTIAVVGSRHPTSAGVDAAKRIACGLAEANFTVVSGLAVGIDAVAHKAAIEAGGYTIAVLGCGLDVDYPARNTTLKRQIANVGTLVTEHPPGTPPHANHFPQRNRIIAGLAAGVVYVEGGERSGGRITARQALDANRSVFAVPGSIRNPLAVGPNELIRTSQAVLITDVRHIFEELAPGLVWKQSGATHMGGSSIPLEDPEYRVLSFLDDAPVAVDRISADLAMPVGEVTLTLSRLEVRGLVTRRPSGYEITISGARGRSLHRATEDS
jgi:DNA processing protein